MSRLLLTQQEEILREAERRLQNEYHGLMLDVFLEPGGSRNLLLTPSDIRAKLTSGEQ